MISSRFRAERLAGRFLLQSSSARRAAGGGTARSATPLHNNFNRGVASHVPQADPASCRQQRREDRHPPTRQHCHRQQQQNFVLSNNIGISNKNDVDEKNPLLQQQYRCYHATRQREILPLIGAAFVFVTVRYSYKAWKRMDDEWEEYQWQLRQYERRRAAEGDARDAANRRLLAVDIGSVYTKLASNCPPKPDVIVSREGDRFVFNGVLYEEDVEGSKLNSKDEPLARGRAALERFYYDNGDSKGDGGGSGGGGNAAVKPTAVRMPWNASDDEELTKILGDSLTPVLVEALERVEHSSGAGGNKESGRDEEEDGGSGDGGSAFRWRTVVTIPVEPDHAQRVAHAHNILPSPTLSSDVVLLPEPVAAIWGAQARSLLPHFGGGGGGGGGKKAPSGEDGAAAASSSASAPTCLVVDVGGFVTQCSIVRNDVVLGSNVVPWGGENLIRTVADLLLSSSSSSNPPLSDSRSLSAIQKHARDAVAELSSKSRVKVHVPYLFPDPKQHHLDVDLSRGVVEQAVRDSLAMRYKRSGDDAAAENLPDYLSHHMGLPTDLTSLWTSALTRTLEECSLLPSNIRYVLMVGGGMKGPVVRSSWQSALQMLGIDQTSEKVVVPGPDSCGETTVLGAATLPHAYDYSIEDGLQQRIT